MPQFSHTGMLSHRHPMYGYGQVQTDPQTERQIQAEEAEQQVEKVFTQPTQQDVNREKLVKILTPTIGALITGGLTYGIARAIDIQRSKAANLAIVMGMLTGISQAASSWLQGWIQKAYAELEDTSA